MSVGVVDMWKEAEAIKEVHRVIADLAPDARARVIDYVQNVLDDEARKVAPDV
jgi:hypothetical protein